MAASSTALRILVTGGTGTVGGHVVRHFLPSFPASVAGVGEASVVDLKVLVRDASSASARALEKDFLAYSHPKVTAELVVGDFSDAASLDSALEGIDSVFLACSNVDEQAKLECNFIDACQRSKGVQFIVKLSTYQPLVGNERVGYGAAHGTIERHLATSGIAHTNLRPDWYMTNLFRYPSIYNEQHELVDVFGDVLRRVIAPEDVARFAVALLLAGKDHPRVQPCLREPMVISGPVGLSSNSIANCLSDRLGGPRLSVRKIDFAEMLADLLKGGLDDLHAGWVCASSKVRVERWEYFAKTSPDAALEADATSKALFDLPLAPSLSELCTLEVFLEKHQPTILEKKRQFAVAAK